MADHLRLVASTPEPTPEPEPDHAVVVWWGGGHAFYVTLFSWGHEEETRRFDDEREATEAAEAMARKLRCPLQSTCPSQDVAPEDWVPF